MKCESISSKQLLVIAMVGVTLSMGAGPTSRAVEKVREGLDHFAAGDFDAAAEAFTEADVAEPENATIAFDRACVAAASGDVERAVELFQQAALARDVDLAGQAHYNLGCLSAEQGRVVLGDDPVTARPQQRQQGLSLLLAAVGHYRDCLKINSEHPNARHNLELIRLFIKHIQARWEQEDREQAREEMGLLEFLQMIEQQQSALRLAVRGLSREQDSPQRRQLVSETAEEQLELQEEIEPLKEKIAAEFQATDPTQTGNARPPAQQSEDAQREQASRLLTQLADEAGRLMAETGSSIEVADFTDAERSQREVLDRLNQIFMVVAPFTNVLQRATQQQEQLVATAEELTAAEIVTSDADTVSESQPVSGEVDSPTTMDAVPPEADYPELQWKQSQVTDWSRMLGLKAESELPGVEAQLQAGPTPDSGGGQDSDPDQEDSADSGDEVSDAAAQLEALRTSLQRAVELSPRIVDHSTSAAESLGESDTTAALPEQQKALELLREIAEPLSQQNNQQEGSGDEQNQQQQPEQSQPDQEQQQQQQQQSAQQRAESVLRRARQREREHRQLEKQLRQLIGGSVRVDRDW